MPDTFSQFDPLATTEQDQDEFNESIFLSGFTGFKVPPQDVYDNLDESREAFKVTPEKEQNRYKLQWQLADLTAKQGNLADQWRQNGGKLDDPMLEGLKNNDTDIQSYMNGLDPEDVSWAKKQLEGLTNLVSFQWQMAKYAAEESKGVASRQVEEWDKYVGKDRNPFRAAPLFNVGGGPASAMNFGPAFFHQMKNVEGGNLYWDLRNTLVDGNPIPHNVADVTSQVYGYFAAVVEFGQDAAIAAIPGSATIFEGLSGKVVKGLAEKKILKNAVLKYMAKHGAEALERSASEILEEIVQNTGQALASEYAKQATELSEDPANRMTFDEITKALGNTVTKTSWKDVAKQAWDTTAQLAIPTLLMSVPGAGVGVTKDLYREGIIQQEAGRISEQMKRMYGDEAGGGPRVPPPDGREGKFQQYQTLLDDLEEIKSRAKGKDMTTAELLNKEGWKGTTVDKDVARAVHSYDMADKTRPFKTTVEEDADIAMKYKGKPNGTEWYRFSNLHEFIRDESVDEQMKFFSLMSILSANVPVEENFRLTKEVWEKYKAGMEPEDIVASTKGIIDKEKVANLLTAGYDDENTFRIIRDSIGLPDRDAPLKTKAFMETLKFANVDPQALYDYANAVLDRWMNRYFLGKDRVRSAYDKERMNRRVRAVRDYLRRTDNHLFWTTDRVQAALWAYAKEEPWADTPLTGTTFGEIQKQRTQEGWVQQAAKHFDKPMEEVTFDDVELYKAMQGITTPEGQAIHDHYMSSSRMGEPVAWKVLHPGEQGTGMPGPEWKKQIKKGVDRPRAIHVYEANTQAERQFWFKPRARILINNAGLIYDYDVDPLGLKKKYNLALDGNDPQIIGNLEREIINSGYYAYRSGNVIKYFSPVRCYPLHGFSFNISASVNGEQYANAVAQRDTDPFAQEIIDNLDAIQEAANTDPTALQQLTFENAMKYIDHPLFDILRLEPANGHDMMVSEQSLDGVAEVGDRVIFDGKVALFGKMHAQDFVYTSKLYSQTKRPDSIIEGQAPSFRFMFKDKLNAVQFARLAELLSLAGIPGYTYAMDSHNLVLDHLMLPESLGYGPTMTDDKFMASIEKFKELLNKEPKEPGAFSTSVPMPAIKAMWKEHNIITKDEYDDVIAKGEKRDQELDTKIVGNYNRKRLEEIPRHIRQRENLFYPEGTIEYTPTERNKKLIFAGWWDTKTEEHGNIELWNYEIEPGKYTTVTRSTLEEKYGITPPEPPPPEMWEAPPTLDRPDQLKEAAVGDEVYITHANFQKGEIVALNDNGADVKVGNSILKVTLNGLTKVAKHLWTAMQKTKIGLSIEDVGRYVTDYLDRMRLALRDPNTGEIYVAQPGEIHGMIADRLGRNINDFDYVREQGWVDNDGVFFDRDQTFKLLDEVTGMQIQNHLSRDLSGKIYKAGAESFNVEQALKRWISKYIKGEEGAIGIDEEKVHDLVGEKVITEEQELKEKIREITKQAKEAMVQVRRAATEKQRNIKNNKIAELEKKYREAKARQREIARNRKYINETIKYFENVQKQLKKPVKYHFEKEEFTAIKSLLDAIDLKRMSNKTLDALQDVLRLLDMNPEAELPGYIWDNLKRLDKIPLRDFSLRDIRDIRLTVQHYMNVASMKHKVKTALGMLELNETKQKIYETLRPIKDIYEETLNVTKGKPTGFKYFNDWASKFFGIWSLHYDVLIENVSGRNTLFYDIMYRQIADGITYTAKYKRHLLNMIADKFAQVARKFDIKDVGAWLDETVATVNMHDQVLNKFRKIDFTRNQAMSLWRHMRNPDNAAAITEGGIAIRGSGELNRIYHFVDIEQQMAEILGALGPAEHEIMGDFTSQILNILGMDISRVFEEKNGIPIELDPAYWHKDVVASERGEIGPYEELTFLDRWRGKYMRVALEKGFTKSRLGSKKAIVLGAFDRDLYHSIHSGSAYVGLEIPISNASKVFYDVANHGEFKKQFTARYSAEYWNVIEKGMSDIVGTHQDTWKDIEEGAMRLRAAISTAILGINPWIMLKQTVSLPLYATYMNPLYYMKAQVCLKIPGWSKEVESRIKMYLPEYEERLHTGPSRDIAEIFEASGGEKLFGRKKKLKERLTGGIRWFDRLTVMTGIEGCVQQVMAEFRKGKLSTQVKHMLNITDDQIPESIQEQMQQAYKFAWEVTTATQPMFDVTHRSHLSRGSALAKLGTMFSAFTNQAYNLLWRTYKIDGKMHGNWKPFGTALFVLGVVNPLAIMMIDNMRDAFYDRDDKKRKGWLLRWMNNVGSYVYGVRDILSSIISGWDFGLPIERVIKKFIEAGRNMVQAYYETQKYGGQPEEKIYKAIDELFDAILSTRGIPYYTGKKMAQQVPKKVQDLLDDLQIDDYDTGEGSYETIY